MPREVRNNGLMAEVAGSEHDGWLELLRATTVYTGRCSCGWAGRMNDKGRAARELSEHLGEHDAGAPAVPIPVRTVRSKPPR
jgi:hypothetical protein